MITMSEEQLADMLRKYYDAGVWHGTHIPNDPLGEWSAKAVEIRERAIQTLVHRASGGHDDHGREVE